MLWLLWGLLGILAFCSNTLLASTSCALVVLFGNFLALLLWLVSLLRVVVPNGRGRRGSVNLDIIACLGLVSLFALPLRLSQVPS